MIKYVTNRIVSTVNNNPLTSGASSVTVNDEFNTGGNWDIPQEGYLTVGDTGDMQPSADGTPPVFEIIHYTGFTRNGNGTSTFDGLTRGVGNTSAAEWAQGTYIGLSVTGQMLNKLNMASRRMML